MLTFVSCLLLGSSFARAGDVSCEVDSLKPKINAAMILDEASKPAEVTVAEARMRLQKSHEQKHTEQTQKQLVQQQNQKEDEQETSQNNNDKVAAKKTSGMGGIFDILLPSKLRDSVK